MNRLQKSIYMNLNTQIDLYDGPVARAYFYNVPTGIYVTLWLGMRAESPLVIRYIQLVSFKLSVMTRWES